MGSTGKAVKENNSLYSMNNHPDIGRKVFIDTKESDEYGNWGIIKRVDGDEYFVAMNNGNMELVFNRDELRFEKKKKQLWEIIGNKNLNKFSGMMQLINDLKKEGVETLNAGDIKYIFSDYNKPKEQIREELLYLGCDVNAVADLFNVTLPKKKFTKEEIAQQKRLEKMYGV